jgi:hypothetical protein
MMKRIGYVLILIALGHTIVGLIFHAQSLTDVFQAGIFNTINTPARAAAFWFFVFGAMLAAFGGMTQWLLDTVGTLPRFWGWSLLAVCVAGVIFVPVSGFWLGLPPAIALIRQSGAKEGTRQAVLAR